MRGHPKPQDLPPAGKRSRRMHGAEAAHDSKGGAMNERKALVHIKSLIKARGREVSSGSTEAKEPLLDPVEALHHIKTLARAAQGITDMDTAQKHFEMILTLVDKALPKTRKRMR
jgi:hypothetical protein